MQKKLLLALSLVVVLGVGIIIGYALILKKQIPLSQGNKIAQNQEGNSSTVTSENKNSETETVSTTESAWDKLWSSYTSTQGVSFKYPKQILGIGCKADDVFYVPTVVFEDKGNGGIYIAPKYYNEYPVDSNGNQDTTKCQKIMSSLDTVSGKVGVKNDYNYQGHIFGGWSVAIRDVKSQDELKKFVKDMYGEACEINTDRNGLTDEEFTIKGTDMEGGCPMNFNYKILYNAQKGKAVSVDLGQEATFLPSAPGSQDDSVYDNYMIGSIKFN